MVVTKRKRKKNPYQAEVFVAGARVASECFETKAAAQIWHDDVKRRYEQGRGLAGEMTFAQVIAEYKAKEFPGHVAPTRKKRRLKFDFLTEAESPIANVKMRDFGAGTIETLLDWLIKHERAQTPTRKSFREELKAVRVVLSFYRDCYDAQFVAPITKWHWKRTLFKGAVPKKPKDYYIPADHARRWLAALARVKNPVFHGTAVTQITLGLRIGEACAICDDAVDFERKVLTVKRTMEWVREDGTKCRQIVERVKTDESRREIPLPNEVCAVLKQAFGRQPQVLHKTAEGRLVRVAFHMPDGNLLHDETIRGAYTRAFRKVGLPWTATHICRDTNGTLPLGQVSLEEVRVNHGHTSVVETEGYAKVHAMIENRVPETVAALLFRDKGKKNSRTESRTANGGTGNV